MNKHLEIKRINIHSLDVPLTASFNTAISNLATINNIAVQIELADGSIGWGETPTLPPVTIEDQAIAKTILGREAESLPGKNAGEWRRIALELLERLPDYAAVRCGLEMALIDALANSWHIPLFQFFGGYSNSVVTDITIPICPAGEAEHLARQYRRDGFKIIKTKIGLDITGDIERILAIRRGYKECRLLLDANAGFTVEETLDVLAQLRKSGIEPVLLEQPVPRDDWEGLGRLAKEAGVPVAADESCRTPQDAIRIANNNLAQVLNIKLAKCGVIQALEIAAIAHASGLGLMIGGMVETRIAMGFSAHFAAGLGGFDWIDLDTPLLLAHDPVCGGYIAEGARYKLDVGSYGHGGTLKID
jgi:L-alanine-DL-glutamate epimerase-like enolase superfamily enzyme